MKKRVYCSPILLSSSSNPTVPGGGSGQGSIAPESTGYDEWYEKVALGGTNMDCDYNLDGEITQADYQIWLDEELWKG